MGTGKGFGKTILFGEHFVVYGLPAIASALGSETEAKVEITEGSGWEVDDQRPATPGYKKKKYDEALQAIKNVIEHLKINTDEQRLKITFGGDLYAASGVGASAAQCASLARALNDEFDLQLDDAAINQAAYEGEKAYHGTPSGIDNTAATYGGLIWFEKNLEGDPNTIERLEAPEKMDLIIANTGLTASTTKVVNDVRELKDKNPAKFERIFSDFEELANKAKAALLNGDKKKVGELMNRNHSLLQEITVSGEKNDEIVEIARSSGALGAKMTGTGRGGLVIALSPNKDVQKTIKSDIEDAGYTVWKSTIG